MTRRYELPETLAPVVEAIGYSATLSLIHVHGGSRIHIPKPESLDETHPLVELLGMPCVLRLARAVGGSRLDVPVGRSILAEARRDRVLRLWRERMPIPEIARTVGATQQAVYRLLRQARARK